MQQIKVLEEQEYSSTELTEFANKIREVLTLENRNWYLLMKFKVKNIVS